MTKLKEILNKNKALPLYIIGVGIMFRIASPIIPPSLAFISFLAINSSLVGIGLYMLIDTPIKNQGGNFEKITIGEDTWIGNGSLIMADIGNHCIIGAGSVVTNSIPDYSIAVGNPAKIIKIRK